MNGNQQQERSKGFSMVVFIGGFFLQILIYFAGNYYGTYYSIGLTEVIVISLVIFAIGIACWLFARIIVKNLINSRIMGNKAGLMKLENEPNCDNFNCDQKETQLCPLIVGLNEYGVILRITECTSEQDRLYEKEAVYEIEKNGLDNKPWKNIWIFSDNLLSEVDPVINKAEPVLVANIYTSGTRYTIFHLAIKDQENEINARKASIINSINGKRSNYVKFVPIDVNNGYLGKNTLPLLCGSILFSQDEIGQDGKANFIKGYLSIRKNNNDTPIYYSMPRCMLREYSNYFADILVSNGGAQ